MMINGIEDEDKWLAEGIAAIQHNAFYMHRALDANNLREALKYSAQMLSELRTSKLSPHKYYELYMRAFDELRKLEMFFKDESRHGVSIVDLYELVQHAGNILPRMYLLCTVGSVYIKSKEAPAKDVLKDLVEMCRGVQHPIRGLFLRSYLAQISRDKLPDVGSEYEGDADSVMDSVEFVLQNFTEMNKLWVRLQHQGPGRVREKLEKERSELRDLVGKNLHVLGQIEGVDLGMYKDAVLPRVLEQIVNCSDDLAQYYLMDCIIQVFPDEYHLQTLETLLGACPQLQPTVDVKTVLSQLMERLSNYAASSTDVLPEFLQVEAFAKLSSAIGRVIEAQVNMPIVGAITLYVSLLTFTLRVHPDRLDYVDQVLGACVKKLSGKPKLEDQRAKKQVVALLSAPLEKYNDAVMALTLSNYPRVMDHLDNETNKVMAMVIIESIMKNYTCISTAHQVEVLFELIKGLIKDLDGTAADELDEEDFNEEQNSVARLIHMLYNDDPEELLKVIEAQVNMPIVGAITLYVSLLTFTLRVHPDRLDYVDQVLGACVKKLSGKTKLEDQRAKKQVVALLSAPLEKYNDAVMALTLSNYPRVMDHLDNETNKVMAMVIIESIMKNYTCISTAHQVEVLFELIKGLIKDLDGTAADELDEEDFNEEQNSVARLIHMLYNDDPEELLKIICTVKKSIMNGGPRRLPFTVPPLIFSALRLIRQLQGQDGDVAGEAVPATPKKIFQILNEMIESLSAVPSPELELRLYLQCAEAANDCGLEPVAYEFFTQAFVLYEEEIADSKAQVTAIHLITGTLQRFNVFGVENRDTLTHKATGYSAKLLKKPDQCRAVYACSHLFWVDDQDGIKDGERVLLCLKRALRIANAAQQMANVTRGNSGPVTLFVEILNKYLYFFEKGNPQITSAAIQGLIELITTEMQSESTAPNAASDAFFASTLRYIQFQKQKGGAMGEKYDSVKV
ncbi:vacuolar protein sorting-associated protein 35b [Quercus suber]|uniref:Vacuolar protein sorting-associated protein 35 n=1 Tax=Quercus suber TaxID=58331 RepID=A0AAW0LPX4_QUESU